MRILAIETSCDETAAAVLDCKNDNIKILSNIVASQIPIHQKTGGVVPEVASREHIKTILPVIQKALKEATGENNLKDQLKQSDCIAVTQGPGLMGSLLVGVQTAKTLGWLANKPIVPVNHIAGHIYANWIHESQLFSKLSHKATVNCQLSKPIAFPAIVLVVSGGHTQLVLMKNHRCFKILGETVDDAAGEAFDKVAKLLGLGYPGGPIIESLAKKGDSRAFKFPRPMLKQDNFDFSFSGLKTAVLYASQQLTIDSEQLTKKDSKNICASFQQAAIDVLVEKSLKAIQKYKPKSFLISGGVAANSTLVEALSSELRARNVSFFYPEKKLCTDNAAMIGAAAYFKILNSPVYARNSHFDAEPNLQL